MGFAELILLALALSMDAFAVAVCKGLTMSRATIKKSLIVGLYFGVFQAVMPLIGYFAAVQFAGFVTGISPWIAFILLAAIGTKMIIESLKHNSAITAVCADTSDEARSALSPKAMLPLAVATSIDALAVGVSFALLQVSIIPAVSLIGIVTLVISFIGVKIGSLFGVKFRSKAELFGGIILIGIGLRIFLDHLLS